MARMQWPSAAILAHIHAEVLRRELGCETQVVAGDLSATVASMANTGEPAVAPELWVARVASVWNPTQETQSILQMGDAYSGAPLEGWFIPDFVAENHPELLSASALKDYVNVFAVNGGRARFVSCPPDWACAVINRNLLRALGLENRFEIVEPENRFALDRLIGEAMSSRTPILFYYWQPNGVLAQFNFRQLDLGTYDAEAVQCLANRDCAEPKLTSYAIEPVIIALASWVADVPALAQYFRAARMPVAVMNALLAWQSERGATPEEVALHFVDARADIWQGWTATP